MRSEKAWVYLFLLVVAIVVGILIWNMPDMLEVGDTAFFAGGDTKYAASIDGASDSIPPMRISIIEQDGSWSRIQSEDGTVVRWVTTDRLIDAQLIGKSVQIDRSLTGFDALVDSPIATRITSGNYQVIGWGEVNNGLYFQVKAPTNEVAYWISSHDLLLSTNIRGGYQQ